jgi:hypothetical protein
VLAAAAMAASSVTVVANSLRLRNVDVRPGSGRRSDPAPRPRPTLEPDIATAPHRT